MNRNRQDLQLKYRNPRFCQPRRPIPPKRHFVLGNARFKPYTTLRFYKSRPIPPDESGYWRWIVGLLGTGALRPANRRYTPALRYDD